MTSNLQEVFHGDAKYGALHKSTASLVGVTRLVARGDASRRASVGKTGSNSFPGNRHKCEENKTSRRTLNT